MNKYNYHNIEPISKEDAEAILSSDNIEHICNTMISISFYELDWKWAQDKFIQLFNNNDIRISSMAATCLGHTARVHGRLEKNKVIEILKSRLHEKDLTPYIEDALEDIAIYIS